MISFEIGDSSWEITWKFLHKLFENGIIAFSAGQKPTRVRFLLPITLTDKHIDEIFDIIKMTLDQIEG
jgi:4-aminobutyrate aminotransferase-like enzyme